MSAVTLSANFELVVPKEIREALHLSAGEQFRVVPYDGRLEFISVRPIQSMRGFPHDMDTSIERDEDRNQEDQ